MRFSQIIENDTKYRHKVFFFIFMFKKGWLMHSNENIDRKKIFWPNEMVPKIELLKRPKPTPERPHHRKNI